MRLIWGVGWQDAKSSSSDTTNICVSTLKVHPGSLVKLQSDLSGSTWCTNPSEPPPPLFPREALKLARQAGPISLTWCVPLFTRKLSPRMHMQGYYIQSCYAASRLMFPRDTAGLSELQTGMCSPFLSGVSILRCGCIISVRFPYYRLKKLWCVVAAHRAFQ